MTDIFFFDALNLTDLKHIKGELKSNELKRSQGWFEPFLLPFTCVSFGPSSWSTSGGDENMITLHKYLCILCHHHTLSNVHLSSKCSHSKKKRRIENKEAVCVDTLAT